jgi:hypothetical protein
MKTYSRLLSELAGWQADRSEQERVAREREAS